MPRRRWFQIWPIVRHVWVIWTGFHVANHNSVWRQMGAIPKLNDHTRRNSANGGMNDD
jgi:hypothetical protein